MTTLTETHSLSDLAAAANREHAACERAYGSALEHAFRAGEYLLAAKAEVAHGEWMGWVEANFAGSYRTAARYMQIAEAEELPRVADSSMREVLETLAVPRVPALAAGDEVDAETEDAGRVLARLTDADELAEAKAKMEAESARRDRERFPRPGFENTTVRQVRAAARWGKRLLDGAVELGDRGIHDWSCAQALHSAARQYRDAADALTELAKVLERRAWD